MADLANGWGSPGHGHHTQHYFVGGQAICHPVCYDWVGMLAADLGHHAERLCGSCRRILAARGGPPVLTNPVSDPTITLAARDRARAGEGA